MLDKSKKSRDNIPVLQEMRRDSLGFRRLGRKLFFARFMRFGPARNFMGLFIRAAPCVVQIFLIATDTAAEFAYCKLFFGCEETCYFADKRL